MKTIIHIGQHKTGTTSIQKFLQDNRVSLMRNGLYVPSNIAGYNHPSHFVLNIYSLADKRYSPMKEKIIKQKGEAYLEKLKLVLENDIERIYEDASQNQCDKVLWSNEGLYLLNSLNEYAKLKSLFSKFSSEIEIVCCFREIESYRQSYIKQLTKNNGTLSDNPDSYRYLAPDSWLLDYSRKKELLSMIFDQCSYFSYDSNDNVKKFMKSIGFNSVRTETYRLNVTKDIVSAG